MTESLLAESKAARTDNTIMRDRVIALVMAAAGIAALWLQYVGTSLWLDETGTAWVVSSSLGDAVRRSRFEGQSPAYYIVAWFARHLFGKSEIALRLPSLLAALITVWIVYRLGRRLLGERTGLVAAVALVVLAPFAFAAVDARPYAIAVMLFTAATLMLVRWEEGHALRFAAGYTLLSAAMIYFSYFFAVGFLAHGVYAYERHRSGEGVAFGRFVAALAAAGVLVLPVVPHVRALLGQNDILLWANYNPGIARFIVALLPVPIVGGILVATAVTRFTRRLRPLGVPSHGTGLFLVLLAFGPTELLFLMSIFVARKFFQPRYYLAFAPGMALLAGWVIARISSRAGRAAGMAALVLVGAANYNGSYHHTQDWRTTARIVNEYADENTPVLVWSGFSSRSKDPERQGLLLAPFSTYPMKGRIISLPFDLVGSNDAFVYRIVTQDLEGYDRFLLVEGFRLAPFRTRILQILEPKGYSTQTLFSKTFSSVVLFTRGP